MPILLCLDGYLMGPDGLRKRTLAIRWVNVGHLRALFSHGKSQLRQTQIPYVYVYIHIFAYLQNTNFGHNFILYTVVYRDICTQHICVFVNYVFVTSKYHDQQYFIGIPRWYVILSHSRRFNTGPTSKPILLQYVTVKLQKRINVC